MGRRNRSSNDDWIFDVARLVVFGVILAGFFPIFFYKLMGFLLTVALIVVAGIVLGLYLYRWANRPVIPLSEDRYKVYDLETLTVRAAPCIVASQPPPDPLLRRPEFRSKAEFIQQVRSIDWYQFEKLVAAVYRKKGYAVTRRGGANPDGGIDLVIEKEGERIAVQCKQWKAWNVGVKAIREFLGALTDAGIQKGIFVTIRDYTTEAKQLAYKHGIEIINETGLVKLLEATDADYDPDLVTILRDTRKICPKCESQMVLRTAEKGRGAGQQFWGCAAYPRCHYTMRAT